MIVKIIGPASSNEQIASDHCCFSSHCGFINLHRPGALTKMPVVMQNTMNEMQQMMQPMIQRIGRMQQEVVAEKKKSGG
jgi:peroxiredoxin family protein